MYVESLSSKDVDVTDYNEVRDFFHNNDVVADSIINLSGYNHNMMLHKYENHNTIDVKRQLEVNIEGNLNILANCIGKLPVLAKQGYSPLEAKAELPVIGVPPKHSQHS